MTFSTYRRGAYLLRPGSPELFLKHTDMIRQKHAIKILGYVIMPEHVHLVVVPPDGLKLGLVIGELKSRMAKEFFADSGHQSREPRVYWQRRCYDHNCRSPETVREKINYCHTNPVKRGLVSEPDEWRWSSYTWYRGDSEVPLEMDAYEL